MHVYPAPVRRALKQLAGKNLDMGRISAKSARLLLRHGMHGPLPSSLYATAISISVHTIGFFHPSVVKASDLMLAIGDVPSLVSPLLEAACFHRRDLLTCSDGHVLRKLLESDFLTVADAEFLVNVRGIPAASILRINPQLASSSMRLTDSEVESVFASVPSSKWSSLYRKLDVTLLTVMRLVDSLDVPPLHRVIRQLRTPEVCLALALRFPEHPVLDYIRQDIKSQRRFVCAVNDFVVQSLPAMYPPLNRFLASMIPMRHLIDIYGVKAFAMFDDAYCSMRHVDIRALSAKDAEFVERNIAAFDAKAREFALLFRQHIQHTQGRTITMYVPGTLVHVKRQKHQLSTSVEDILKHVEAISSMRRPRTKDVERIFGAYRYDMSLAKRVLTSDASTRVKRKMLKAMCRWKVLVSPDAVTGVRLTRSCITWDACAFFGVRVFRLRDLLPGTLPALPLNKLPMCHCDRCAKQRVTEPSLPSDLRGVLFTGGTSPCEISDESLLTTIHDLCVLASHGVLDVGFVSAPPGWGPLMSVLTSKRVDAQQMRKVLTAETLATANLTAGGLGGVSAMAHFQHMDIHAILPYERVLRHGEHYVRVMLFFSVVMEYMLMIAMYRTLVLRTTARLREFVAKLVNYVLEAFGVRFCFIRVHDCVEYELYECARDGTLPFHTVNLFIKVLTVILEHLNGAG
uniref:Uncharacterized protein n=1 Tax=Rousettus bat poxvirus TaxID=3141933 RepID=A0AAU7E1E4_9POXV